MLARLIDRLKALRSTFGPANPPTGWIVEWDNTVIRIKRTDGTSEEGDHEFLWNSIVRVCFSDGGMAMSDWLILSVHGTAKPLLLPLEARGGTDFMDELHRRDYFPREIFDRAMRSTDGGTYCWPPDDANKDR